MEKIQKCSYNNKGITKLPLRRIDKKFQDKKEQNGLRARKYCMNNIFLPAVRIVFVAYYDHQKTKL